MQVRLMVAWYVAFFLVSAQFAEGQTPEMTSELLWTAGPPGAPPSALAQDGDLPKLMLTIVASDKPTAAVVILPGGGYQTHAIDHEGYQFADWFRSIGISSAICTYRHRGKGNGGKGYGHPYPMLDAQRAIQTIRARAAEWNVDPNRIGVIGFSAGGHLASTISTHFAVPDVNAEDPIARVSSRPDFAILCYPVIAFAQSHTHRGSQRNLLGDQADPTLIEDLSNERRVSKMTPPTFLFHTAKDQAVPADNSLHYYLGLLKHGVAAELHIFPEGAHGLGLSRSQPGAAQWPALCQDWLGRLGMAPANR